MTLEKYILAVVTTKPEKVPVGAHVFHCSNKEEMDAFAANLEAILDGIAHALTEDIYIIVKH
ncbi:capping complex subunit for YIEGIA [Peribacillus tepidiphilus]|uniref:capping complex subunit for YIEGIA n=1 Tax=Peribacillus tepidiphilus TaxID=2652445 RepID=UPI0035B53F91